MSNILSHKGNASQNYTKFPSHARQIGNHQENKEQKLLVRIGVRWKELSYTAVEISMEIPQKTKNRPTV
jgi:hypothetical protein